MTSIKTKNILQNLQRNYVKREVKDGVRYIQLDRNENAFGYSNKVAQAIENALQKLSRYPDLHAIGLVRKLAEVHNIAEKNIAIGNGSFELITSIAQIFINPGDESVIPTPTFEWYKMATYLANGSVKEVPLTNDHKVSLDRLREAITDKTRIIWLCNPNNPTGTALSGQEVYRFAQTIPSDVLLVIDEAYVDFVREVEPTESFRLVSEFPNVILLRTFSKVYGLAALRIGYAVANEYITESIRNFKTPMSINFIAVEAAIASLEDRKFRILTIAQTARQLDYYYEELDRLELSYIRSDANFLMINIGYNSEEIVRELKDKKNIIVRGGSEFNYPNWLRITIGSASENKTVIETLEKVLNKQEQTVSGI